MTAPLAFDEPAVFRLTVRLAGVTFGAGAAVAARLAGEHMAALGTICGGAQPHCGWCFAAAGLAVTAAGFLLAPIPRLEAQPLRGLGRRRPF